MGAFKTKVPRLKSLSGQTATGGAPFFSEDFVTLQENARADSLNNYEELRRKLPNLLFHQGAGNPTLKEFENGIILSGCQYDNTDSSNPVISSGYIYSGGEVCYFPGGTFATGSVNGGLIYLFKGASTAVSRTFADGADKEMLISFATTVEQGIWGANGPELQAGTAITSTDEVVVISCGASNYFTAEQYFSKQAALKIYDLGVQATRPTYTSATLEAGVSLGSLNQPFMVSRVLEGGFTHIVGSVTIDFSVITGNETIFKLGSHAITTNSVAVSAGYVSVTQSPPSIIVTFGGIVRILLPASGTHPTGTRIISFNTIVYGKNTVPADTYQYKRDFLNIT